MLKDSIIIFYRRETQRLLSKNALESTDFTILNQYKTLRTLPFIKVKRKKT